MNLRKKGFTLIELIAVLVILAILALIVTPLVMNIIRKARISADKRSVDAYGRSVELAIANYLLDNGDFPTDVSQLTIEYSGDRVECSTTQLNSDSSVYLAGCTVGGRSVDYAYGNDKSPTYTAYSIGDEVTYNNINYYVIKDSSASEETVTLLKAEPLTVAEVNQYGAGHINRNTSSSVGTAYNANGYGGMAYYSSDLCNLSVQSGCTNSYEDSDIKYVVDAWAQTNTVDSDLVVDLTGYSARLLTYEELITNLGYSAAEPDVTTMDLNIESVPDWVYNSNYWYWTMSQYQDEMIRVWRVGGSGNVDALSVYDNVGRIVRPVITISKSSI